jgi:transposase
MDSTIASLLALDAKVDELTARIAKLSKNSSNSSKPPSSDITKPPQCAQSGQDKKKRKKGGQWNHPKWERLPFGPDEVVPIEHTLTSCPHCTGPVERLADEPSKILQQIGLSTPAVEKTEHRAPAYWCPRCRCVHYASFPVSAVKEGLFKPDISATVCFLKYAGCMSLSGIKRYIADAWGVRVTKGYLAKVLQKGAKTLESCYDELLQALPLQPVVNGDETGHKENGKQFWTWVFRSSIFTLFRISPSRGSDVLIEVLGKEFDGVLGCDYFSAYRKFMTDFDVRIQFCLAHLIRDVKFLVDFPDASVKRYGIKILDALRELFKTVHAREKMSPECFAAQLEERKDAVLKAGTGYVPARSEAENMAKRLRENGKSYFTFITTPQIDPTNNCAEQAIRFVVIYRKVSQGTRSENGRIACERFFTVIATCARQGKSAFVFIKESFEKVFAGLPAPSLLPVNNSP